jgi:hypothetical protein
MELMDLMPNKVFLPKFQWFLRFGDEFVVLQRGLKNIKILQEKVKAKSLEDNLKCKNKSRP